jgi:hypothetical protein
VSRSFSLALGLLTVAVVTVGMIYLFVASFGLIWTPYTCLTDVHGGFSGPSGVRFEISETSCSIVAKGPGEISVFVSKANWRKKTLLFKYEAMHDASSDAWPVVTSVDEHTVQISVKHVASIVCRSDKWGTLAVRYNIGLVVDPGDGLPRGCDQN